VVNDPATGTVAKAWRASERTGVALVRPVSGASIVVPSREPTSVAWVNSWPRWSRLPVCAQSP